MTRRKSFWIVTALCGSVLTVLIQTRTIAWAGKATLNVVMVLDGLRPGSITADETPNLWRLRQEGVNFLNSHSVFPTVTRTNATAIATGTYPDRNGMFGNRLYVREVDPNHSFGNDDHRNLIRLNEVTGGGMVLAPSLAEILAQRGKTFAVVSSGTMFWDNRERTPGQPARPEGHRDPGQCVLGAGQARRVPGCRERGDPAPVPARSGEGRHPRSGLARLRAG